MDFEVSREEMRRIRCTDTPEAELADGQARLRVDTFALTANNVTYAAFGDAMAYWNFFPAEEGWGRVPVWGFADVAASTVDGLAEGERIYGYFPMSTSLVVTPGRLHDGGFTDASDHRSALPAVYNQYLRVAADPGYDAERESEQALLRPLFMTSFLIDDWLADSDLFGAGRVVLTSASSKTSIGLAHLLHTAGRAEVVGLTSPGNVEAVTALGCYDRTLPYDEVADLDASVATVLVDMAGDGDVRAAVHHHLLGSLRHSCAVGATHWESTAAPVDVPGPTPSFFFAPDRVAKRRDDWGPGGLEKRMSEAWRAFLPFVDRWLEVEDRRGADEVERSWVDMVEGRIRPDRGLILSLHEPDG